MEKPAPICCYQSGLRSKVQLLASPLTTPDQPPTRWMTRIQQAEIEVPLAVLVVEERVVEGIVTITPDNFGKIERETLPFFRELIGPFQHVLDLALAEVSPYFLGSHQ